MVNINDVYQTVLTIANKDNRGYITPEEYNRLADIAQNEIFESYFNKQLMYEAGGLYNADFSDPIITTAEKINTFYKSGNLSQSSGTWAFPTDFYKLGSVQVNSIEADFISHKDVKFINQSPLTYPVTTQPVYTIVGSAIRIYPSTITSGVNIEYLKAPNAPKWGYIMPTAAQLAAGVPNEPIYDSTVFDPATDSYSATAKSLNFELHTSEYSELIYKILTLAGVTIKQADIAGFAQSKDQQLQATEQ